MLGTCSPVCMMSLMRSNSLRPSEPAGCERAKSSAVKPRASSSAMASASPITSVAVVLEVGARFSGQASTGTLTSRCTSAMRASEEFGLPLIATSGTPWRLISGRMASSSSVSPELLSARTTSFSVIMPRSPWLASAGCTKKAGVPVLASVAAILFAMCPDLPMPDTTMRPVQSSIRAQARKKLASSRVDKPRIASASMSKTRRALADRRSGSSIGCIMTGVAGFSWAFTLCPGRRGGGRARSVDRNRLDFAALILAASRRRRPNAA